MTKTRVEFQIEEDIKTKAENAAESEGMGLSAWIRNLIIKALNSKQTKK